MRFIPSDSQRRAICHKDGPLLVLAGPGSGKTAVIIQRLRHLIQIYHIPPEQILAITFTKAAADQLRHRFSLLTDRQYPQVTIRTFHSLFYLILKHTYGESVPRIADGRARMELARKVLAGDDQIPSQITVSSFLSTVSRIKTDLFKGESSCMTDAAIKSWMPVLFGRYEALLAENRLMDMDDILVNTRRLLRTCPHILSFWQRQFPYILVDEFQDISGLQFDSLYLLSGSAQNLFAVGDDDQSIYRFRGARPDLMLDFFRYFPKGDKMLLETNYRCPKKITRAAGRLIACNQKRYEKKIVSFQKEEGCLTVKEFASPRREAEYVVSEMTLHLERGGCLSDCALLFRNRRQAFLPAQLLLQHNIPFVMKEGLTGLSDHWIIGDLLAYVRIARNQESLREIMRIMNRPNRYLSREKICQLGDGCSLQAVKEAFYHDRKIVCAVDKWQRQNRILEVLPPYEALQYIRKEMGYESFLLEYGKMQRTDPAEYLEILEEFSLTVTGLSGWEEYDRLQCRGKSGSTQKNQDALCLSTIHGAKGLEFDKVYILDVNQGITPYQKDGVTEDPEEERRLFYVAMTRAKKELQLLYVKNKTLQPSQYLSEALENKRSVSR